MATVEEDYYAVLEVSRSASNEEIKQAYKVMARRWHPDRHADRKAEAEERFKAVGRAFNVLSDPQKRSRYDRFGPDWESGVPSSAAAAASPSGAHSFYAFQAQPGVYVDPWGAGGSARPFFSSAFAFQDPVVKRGFRDGHAPGSASAGFDVPDILASLGLYGQHGPGCTCGSHTHQAHHAHHAYHHQQHQQRHFQDFQQAGVRPAAYADPYSGTAAASAPKKAAAKPNKTAAKSSHKPPKTNSPRAEQKSDIKAPTPTRSAVPTAAAPSTPLEVVIELPPSATAAQGQSPARAQSPEQIAKPRLDAVDSPLPAAEVLTEKKPKIAFDKKSPLTSPARSKSPTDSHNNTSVPDTFPRAPDPPSQSTPLSATTNSLPLAAESASSSATSSPSVLPSSKPAADLASPQQVPTLRPPSPPSFGVTSIPPQPSSSPSTSSSAPSPSSASPSSSASSSSSSSTSASSSSSANSSGFFSSLFGGGGGTGGKKAASKAPDVRHTLECTLEELSVGITRQVSVTERLMSKRGPVSRQVEYPVKIPPGACEGMVIRIKNAGDQGPDQLRGDRLFVIQERKHALFERQGDDLLYKVEISLRHALTGCVISLVTITEKKMNIEIRDIIHPNFVHTIKGEGMPRATAPLQRGDLLVTFILRFPVSLTSDQRAHITAGLRGTC